MEEETPSSRSGTPEASGGGSSSLATSSPLRPGSSSRQSYSDRFIPSRRGVNLQDSFAMLPDSPPRKRDAPQDGTKDDNLDTYTMLLRSELLGSESLGVNVRLGDGLVTIPSIELAQSALELRRPWSTKLERHRAKNRCSRERRQRRQRLHVRSKTACATQAWTWTDTAAALHLRCCGLRRSTAVTN